MERFTAGAALTTTETADLLDVHASTVKRWCNRGELAFGTTEGGHRRIQLHDALAFADTQGIDTVLSPFHPFEPHVWGVLDEIRTAGSFDRLHTLAMGWVFRGQLERLGVLYEVVAREPSVSFATLVDVALRELMRRVGEAWARGKLRISDEHMVTQAMTEVLLRLRVNPPGTSERRGNGAPRPRAVVGTVEGDQHHLASQGIRILLERLGWEVAYLGPDVPMEEFAAIQKRRGTALVAISLTPPTSAGDVARAVRALGDLYDPDLPYALALGGQVTGAVDPRLLEGPFAAVGLFDSCAMLEDALSNGFAGDAPAPIGGSR